jgi:hypothetical protein
MDESEFVVAPVVLEDVVIYHGRADIGGCRCGWGEIGRSHAGHVVAMARLAMSGSVGWDEAVGRFAVKDPFYPPLWRR